ncbi:MAG: nucleotide exchange factor GrpE [Methylococcales bacterium]|nr:nucleotide exchange factor GrpE [Methylococcales bacterium]
MSNEQNASEPKSDSELIDEVLEQASEHAEDVVNESEENQQPDDSENEAPEEISLEELQIQLKKAQQTAEENWDKAVRAKAEMENLKRRTQKDLENAHKYGLEKFSKELLSVIDSLELGIQASTSDNPEVVALKQGSELTIKQFEAVFAKFNIEALDPMGQPFNPELHQAMTMQPSADVEPNTVINVFQKGYILNGRLIRPAMVVVSQAAKPIDESIGDSTNLDEQA